MPLNLQNRPAISYARYSSQGQDNNDSLRRQAEIFELAVKSTGAVATNIQLVDEAKSGFKGEHIKAGSLGAFIEQLETMSFSQRPILFIEKWDRLGRQKNSITQDVLNKLLKHVDVYDCSDGQLVTQSTENDLGASIMLLVKIHAAWQYSKNLSDRIRAAKESQFKQSMQDGALVPHGGYPRWLVVKDKKAALIPKRASSIKKVFELYLSGMTLGAIAKYLNTNNYLHWNRAGEDSYGSWNSYKLSQLIRQPSLYGSHVSRTWKTNGERFEEYSGWNAGGIEIKNAYPAVVSEETYNLAQSIREQTKASLPFNKSKSRSSTRSDGRNIYPVSTCSMCGSNYVLKMNKRKGKSYPEFLCSNKKAGGKCDSSSLSYVLAEQMLLNLIFKDLNIKKLFEKKGVDTKAEKLQSQTQALSIELKELQDRVQMNTLNSKRTSSTILIAIDELEQQIEELKKQRVTTNEDYKFLRKQWRDLCSAESHIRVRALRFMETIIDSIEITSIKRGTKLVRVHLQQDRVIMATSNGRLRQDEYHIHLIDGTFK
ncbi:recombinase family protein [Vibrio chagasii]|uniref:recombinase family protein n=4 Tax=Vibrio TaxID=662 RepID=UPI00354B3408